MGFVLARALADFASGITPLPSGISARLYAMRIGPGDRHGLGQRPARWILFATKSEVRFELR